jgi:Fe-S cluster assembly protein SufD
MSFFVDALSSVDSTASDVEPPWIVDLRARGRETFALLGVPSKRHEKWKYTSLRAAEQVAFSIPDATGDAPVPDRPLPAAGGDVMNARLVFINGRLCRHLSTVTHLPDGVRLAGLREVLDQNRPEVAEHLGRIAPLNGKAMPALNAALFEDGFTLFVEPGTVVKEAIEIVWAGGQRDMPTACFPRNLVVLGTGSRATLIERYAGGDAGVTFANSLTEIAVAESGALVHIRQQDENGDAFHVASISADIAQGGSYKAFTFSLGTHLARNDWEIRLVGSDSECNLSGVYMLREHQHCDNTTVIRHCAPRTRCREVFKGVVDDDAHAVFQGSIVVERDAQQADGQQVSKAILLSDRAEVDQKPELEISANDVKCSHGAAVGQLDAMALFYLRSRGIPEAMARRILVEGFLAEAFDEIGDAAIRSEMTARASTWFDERMPAEQ